MKKTVLAVSIPLLLASGCSTLAPEVSFPDEERVVVTPARDMNGDASVIASEEKDKVEVITPAKSKGEIAQYERALEIERTGYSEGSIYNSSGYKSLFTDTRARAVGDLLTVEIAERMDSRQNDSTSVSKDDSIEISFPEIRGFFGLDAAAGEITSSKDFSGSGSTRANNQVVGTISVVVTEVLPSGNLRVKGERQIGTNREVKNIKFYGIVNPRNIRNGNRVASSEVAEARIEYRGQGAVDSAQAMGWLSRFFLSVLPF